MSPFATRLKIGTLLLWCSKRWRAIRQRTWPATGRTVWRRCSTDFARPEDSAGNHAGWTETTPRQCHRAAGPTVAAGKAVCDLSLRKRGRQAGAMGSGAHGRSGSGRHALPQPAGLGRQAGRSSAECQAAQNLAADDPWLPKPRPRIPPARFGGRPVRGLEQGVHNARLCRRRFRCGRAVTRTARHDPRSVLLVRGKNCPR